MTKYVCSSKIVVECLNSLFKLNSPKALNIGEAYGGSFQLNL